MTVCRSKGEPEGTRHKDDQLQCCLACWLGARVFLEALSQQTQFAGHSKAEAHRLVAEGLPFDRSAA